VIGGYGSATGSDQVILDTQMVHYSFHISADLTICLLGYDEMKWVAGKVAVEIDFL
jgi:hypothetical protein